MPITKTEAIIFPVYFGFIALTQENALYDATHNSRDSTFAKPKVLPWLL